MGPQNLAVRHLYPGILRIHFTLSSYLVHLVEQSVEPVLLWRKTIAVVFAVKSAIARVGLNSMIF